MNQRKWFIKQGVILTIISCSIAVFSFVKEAVFANFFGASSVADAYTIAIQIPEILFAVVWNAINVVVIPLYTEKYCNEGKSKASAFISGLITLFALGAFFLLILGELFTDEIVFLFSPGLADTSHNLAVSLMKCVLPMLFFEGIIRISSGVLNVHKEFVVPKVLSCVRNIGIIVFLFLFTSRFGIFAAAYGLLSGIFIECLITLLFTAKYERYRIHLNINDPTLRKAGKMAVPVIFGVGASEINQIADKIIASFLDSGSIASLNYSSKLSSIIETVFLGNIITLMYPTYSRLIALKKFDELAKAYTETIKTTILLSMPIAFGGLFLCNEIVTLAFKRGAFDETSVVIVGELFACYLFGSMLNTIRLIGVKLFTAFCDTKTPMMNSMFGSMLNIALNMILSRFLGVVGLALATTISTGAVGMILLRQAKEKAVQIEYGTTGILAVKTLSAALVMCFVLYVIKMLLVYNAGIGTLIFMIIAVPAGAGVYGMMLYLLKVSEIRQLLHMAKNKAGNK